MTVLEVVTASGRVGATRSRLEKVGVLADLLRRASSDEVGTIAKWLVGDLPQGRIGIGIALLRDVRAAVAPAAAATLLVRDVDASFTRLRDTTGAGSSAARRRVLAELFARATEPELDFLTRLALGELRQGALEGLMVDALARAADVPPDLIRRAFMSTGDLGLVASAALSGGAAALQAFAPRVLTPVLPMLAQTAADPAEALAQLGGRAVLDAKLDGARVQVHKAGEEVRVFSRSLRDVTPSVPEVVAAARALPASSVILDGEALAFRPDGKPQPFQVTMRRFGRGADDAALRAAIPLSVYFFDVLHCDGSDLMPAPARDRFDRLAALVPASQVVPRTLAEDAAAATTFMEETLRRGHEGIVAKALDAPYDAGSRGGAWLKVKPAITLDLVVLAAEWGSGRRVGYLSNLHLAARDLAAGGFAMLGKTFKGMTDAMLAWQTERLLALEQRRDGHVVHVAPILVVEVAFDGIQASSRYESGLALRFARVKRWREDKTAADADTLDTVRAIYAGQGGRGA